ncbi:recombinase family protein [Nonomuraea sp. GTA35]|uniref:recombinase family protein n=1 Tax=Nonomuraea sp. GTA35 TaxID=1676746 RepID=UPI0035BF3606
MEVRDSFGSRTPSPAGRPSHLAREVRWCSVRRSPPEHQPPGQPARVGYARCSTDEQDGTIQTGQLLALGVSADRIYIDRGFSGTTCRNRGGLYQTLATVWDGNIFTVTKFDRFARNMADANDILTGLSGRGVLFGLGASVYDWNDPFGRLFLQTLAMVAEYEANLGHLRTREGMAQAKKNGKLKGKQPKLPEPARRSIRRRHAGGEVSLADLATEYSVGRSTIHRIIHGPADGHT